MKAKEIMEHFQEVGTWVDWDNTNDQFLHGDPDAEVKGIATAWSPTNSALKQASDKGLNVFITHQPAFYRLLLSKAKSAIDNYHGSPSTDQLARAKRQLLDDLDITLMLCHDTWTLMPDVGIPDTWAAFLGFDTEPRPSESYYKICLLGDMTVEEAAQQVLQRVRSLGQDTVLIFGDRQKRVSRMAVGTGAVTRLPTMYELNADLILATDDGMNFWDGGLWAVDLGIPVLIVNHATSEKPGMQEMAVYLRGIFPGVPVEYVDVEFPYSNL